MLSDSGANQGEGICVGGAAGEKRVCQSRTPRVEGCIKIHSGGFGGEGMGEGGGGGIGGGGSSCLNTDQPSCSSNTLQKILRTGVRRRRLGGSERRVERSGRGLMRLRKAAVAPATHLEIGRRRVRGFLFMSARRVTECVCHSVTSKKQNWHRPLGSCCAPPAVHPSVRLSSQATHWILDINLKG